MKVLVSVIVPVYNVEKYLEQCIDSIINQTYKNLEIILIDDGSTDGSGRICDEYTKKDTRIKVIHKENGGVSTARNFGLKEATGEYVCFVDSDDEIKEEYVETLVRLMIEKKVDISIVNFVTKHPEYDEKPKYFLETKMLGKKQFLYHLFQEYSNLGTIFCKMFKTKIIINNKIFFDANIHICEDLLFICQLADKCERFYYDIDTCLYDYYIRENSALRSKYSWKTATRVDVYDDIISILEKNNINTIHLKKDYVYYALVAKNELKNIDKKTKIKYISIAKKYMNEILKSKEISKIDKIRLIVMLYFSSIFKIIKKIKNYGKDKTNENHKNK